MDLPIFNRDLGRFTHGGDMVNYIGRLTIASLVFSFLFIFLVDVYTISPQRISGNGNLGIVPLFLGSITTIFFCVFLAIWLKRKCLKHSVLIIIAACSVVVCLCAVIFEFRFISDTIDKLGGNYKNPHSKIYRYGALNQYTNVLFLNLYVFLCFTSIITAFVSLLNLVRLKSSNTNNNDPQ